MVGDGALGGRQIKRRCSAAAARGWRSCGSVRLCFPSDLASHPPASPSARLPAVSGACGWARPRAHTRSPCTSSPAPAPCGSGRPSSGSCRAPGCAAPRTDQRPRPGFDSSRARRGPRTSIGTPPRPAGSGSAAWRSSPESSSRRTGGRTTCDTWPRRSAPRGAPSCCRNFRRRPPRPAKWRRDAAIVLARLLHVVGAAVVARKLAHDVVAIGLLGGADDLLALRLEIAHLPLSLLLLLREVDAGARAAQRLGEQEILVAACAARAPARSSATVCSAWRMSASSRGSWSRDWLVRWPSCTSRCSSCRQMGFFVDQSAAGGRRCGLRSAARGRRALPERRPLSGSELLHGHQPCASAGPRRAEPRPQQRRASR